MALGDKTGLGCESGCRPALASDFPHVASGRCAHVGDELVAHSWDGKKRRVVLSAVAPRRAVLVDGATPWLATGEGIFRLDP